jgi:cytochrome d ubiquinol oxidase subunit II
MLPVIWFCIVAVMVAIYFVLDGFDLGAGIVHLCVARTAEERRLVLKSIGPVWDGNEVWLITGGGALFAAFPRAYATAFSGFYPAMMLVLCALIFRAVSIEFRAHDEARAGIWEKAFFAGSALAAVPLDDGMEFTGNFFTLLRPVPLLFGITGFAAVCLQGASYALMKTEGELRERCFRAVRILTIINFITAMAYFTALAFTFEYLSSNWLFYVSILCTFLWLAEILFSIRKKHDFAPFWESSFAFIGLWLAVAAVHFPNLIKASNGRSLSMTIYNSSTGLQTLKLMSVIALIGMPIVIAYTIFVYRIFKGKAKSSDYY